jgi:hypothetical protein
VSFPTPAPGGVRQEDGDGEYYRESAHSCTRTIFAESWSPERRLSQKFSDGYSFGKRQAR